MGQRPATPDTLPVIGPSPKSSKVFYAFGHGHTGLTFGPTTGRLIAELVAGRRPSLDLSPFTIARFGADLLRGFCKCNRIPSSASTHIRAAIPVRVAGGGPLLPNVDMAQKRQIFVAEHDWVRQTLMFEPRGHDAMSGTILYPASCAECTSACCSSR